MSECPQCNQPKGHGDCAECREFDKQARRFVLRINAVADRMELDLMSDHLEDIGRISEGEIHLDDEDELLLIQMIAAYTFSRLLEKAPAMRENDGR